MSRHDRGKKREADRGDEPKLFRHDLRCSLQLADAQQIMFNLIKRELVSEPVFGCHNGTKGAPLL